MRGRGALEPEAADDGLQPGRVGVGGDRDLGQAVLGASTVSSRKRGVCSPTPARTLPEECSRWKTPVTGCE